MLNGSGRSSGRGQVATLVAFDINDPQVLSPAYLQGITLLRRHDVLVNRRCQVDPSFMEAPRRGMATGHGVQ